MPQKQGLEPQLTVAETVRYFSILNGISKANYLAVKNNKISLLLKCYN